MCIILQTYILDNCYTTRDHILPSVCSIHSKVGNFTDERGEAKLEMCYFRPSLRPPTTCVHKARLQFPLALQLILSPTKSDKAADFYPFQERFRTCSQTMRWRTSLAAWGQRSAARDWWIRARTAGSSSSTASADSSRWKSQTGAGGITMTVCFVSLHPPPH